jgi:nucleoside-diphosphate-sugar epimerase
MRVFVTGATGFVGSAVVKELIAANHQVLGLARSDSSAEALAAAGAKVQRGDVENLDSLRQGAASSEAVIHTAFIHDFTKFKQNCEIDRHAIDALGYALEGTQRPLIVTSGTGLVSGSKVATEDDAPPSGPSAIPRVASEEAAASLAARGIHVSIIRLPPSVHGHADHGFVPHLTALAREKGLSAYVADGTNPWPAVHRLDAAKLYRLILEKGFTPGQRFHAVAEEGIPFRDIAAVIARRLNLPLISKSSEEAASHFGWFAHFAAMGNPSSSAVTRHHTAWRPTQPGLIEDVASPAYDAGK